ncbi:hypothetical protein UR09_00105 [Candidatus Nitromaritima sp. SCGC AAA799-A02]|nr:hypothetical protein UZ36_00105 [Candidatus Nitromaritima sp. SCGC AAA799-C22]KMP12731.1 hypothetical protein UR09_00105 [Candidatus Nitromaritima sp. SCGC AAA799-A02]
MKLHIFDAMPRGFFEVEVHEMEMVFPGPSLIRLKGNTEPPLFVATLLHGNETTGILSLQKFLRKYMEGETLPRSLTLFIGNVEAAKYGQRTMPDQMDFNRIWYEPSLSVEAAPEFVLAQKVMDEVLAKGVFATVDVHNTSGWNPHHACVNLLKKQNINLAGLFSRTVVYFTRPHEVLSRAFAEFGPAVTVEAGRPGDLYGVEHVCDFLERCLNLPLIPNSVEGGDDLNLYHSVARILVPENSRIGFDQECNSTDFCFLADLDSMNFSELEENALIGWRKNPALKLLVLDEAGREIGDRFIHYEENEIRLKRPVVPSMFTTDAKVVHQDCLGYFMERYALTGS